MPFIKTITAPNGATLTFHRVSRAQIKPDGVTFNVHSWPDEAAFLAGLAPLWDESMVAAMDETVLLQLEAGVIAGQGQYAGATPVTAGGDVDQARERRWAAIKAQREALDNQPIAHAGFEVDADATSRVDIMGAVMAMQMGGGTSRPWRCSDNVMRDLTLDDLVQIGQAIAARRQMLIETSDALYQQMQAAATAEDVSAVVWPT